jgi:hypothetical protein
MAKNKAKARVLAEFWVFRLLLGVTRPLSKVLQSLRRNCGKIIDRYFFCGMVYKNIILFLYSNDR